MTRRSPSSPVTAQAPANAGLSDAHRRMLEVDSAVLPEVIEERGYWTAKGRSELLALGFAGSQAKAPALVIPIHGVEGGVVSYQIRPDVSRVIKGKKVKYESIAGQKLRIDVPPCCRTALGDPNVPLHITEGSKKADAAASRGLCAISLSGVYGWRSTNDAGGKVLNPDFEVIALNGRDVYLVFDSDVVRKKQVEVAMIRLARALASRGAIVWIVTFGEPEGQKIGMDDFFARGGTVQELVGLASKWEGSITEESDSKRASQADDALSIIRRAGVELWHDASGEGFATFRQGNGFQSARITGELFAEYLDFVIYQATGRPLKKEPKADLVAILKAKAKYEGPKYDVASRIGHHGGVAYLDLHDDDGRVVKITSEGWDLISAVDCPIRFYSTKHMRALPLPQRGASLDLLRRFFSVDDAGFLGLRAFMVGMFLPCGTFPVLSMSGEQGSGKSLATRILRESIDPVESPIRAQVRDLEALGAAVSNNFVVVCDNSSGISSAMSDALCGVVSGSGMTGRKKYSDADEHLISGRRPVIINGIVGGFGGSDLMDRTMPVELRRLTGPTRRKESELLAEFHACRPRILGALLDEVVLCLKNINSPQSEELPRLADFAAFVAGSLDPEERSAFFALMTQVRTDQDQDLVEKSPALAEIIEFVKEVGGFSGCSKDLLEGLGQRVGDRGARSKGRSWPETPSALTILLKRNASALRSNGIEFELGNKSNRGRKVKLTVGVDPAAAERSDASQLEESRSVNLDDHSLPSVSPVIGRGPLELIAPTQPAGELRELEF